MTIELPTAWIMPFFLLLARVGGLMIFAPFFGNGVVAPVLRVALSVAFTTALFPLAGKVVPHPENFGSFFLVLCGELLVGMLLGFVGRLFRNLI